MSNLSDGLILAWGLLISQSAFWTTTPVLKVEKVAINTNTQVVATLDIDKEDPLNEKHIALKAANTPAKKKEEVPHIKIKETLPHIDSEKEYDRSVQEMRAKIIEKVSIHVWDFNFWVTRDMKDLGFWWTNISLKRKFSTNEYIPNSTLNLEVGTWVVENGNRWVFVRAKFNF